MEAKAKIATMVILIIIVIIAVWQFTSPPILPPVGSKYTSQSIYANRGTFTVLENMSDGRAYIAFSIANVSYPSTTLQTYYTITISNLNQTITGAYVRGFGLRVLSIIMRDNYDGSTSQWGIGTTLTDAIQANGVFSFRTSALHQISFTLTYQLYNILPVGSTPDKTLSDSFNVTQNVF
ncbi:MAG TPA: hypothetical protein VE955_01825 [Candidatus Dormibacteraeota bacterium]|jgi:hypothetical protein|nr:hypothetical protein [Candidatus Dormibacteraeota bacterium]